MDEYSFTVANDLRALDRLLSLEVQNMRATWYLNAGMDYQGVDFNAKEEAELRRTLKETAAQISEVQRDLALTKAQRDQERHDSIGAYIANLKIRAKQHGVKRETELGKAIELCHELFALVGAWQRSNEAERRKLGFEKPEDIITWISDYMQVEFKLVDDYFREHEQRFWVRDM